MATELLKLTSAIVIRGRIIGADRLIEVSPTRGRNLRDRGKAVFATENEIAQGEIDARDFDDAVVGVVPTAETESANDDDTVDTSKRRRQRVT